MRKIRMEPFYWNPSYTTYTVTYCNIPIDCFYLLPSLFEAHGNDSTDMTLVQPFFPTFPSTLDFEIFKSLTRVFTY